MIYVLSFVSYACLMNLLTILFYFVSLVSTEMPLLVLSHPCDMSLFNLYDRSDNEAIYDNLTTSHIKIVEKAPSDSS